MYIQVWWLSVHFGRYYESTYFICNKYIYHVDSGMDGWYARPISDVKFFNAPAIPVHLLSGRLAVLQQRLTFSEYIRAKPVVRW